MAVFLLWLFSQIPDNLLKSFIYPNLTPITYSSRFPVLRSFYQWQDTQVNKWCNSSSSAPDLAQSLWVRDYNRAKKSSETLIIEALDFKSDNIWPLQGPRWPGTSLCIPHQGHGAALETCYLVCRIIWPWQVDVPLNGRRYIRGVILLLHFPGDPRFITN